MCLAWLADCVSLQLVSGNTSKKDLWQNKFEKCDLSKGTYIYDVQTKCGWEFLQICHIFVDSDIYKNRSIVHFFRWWRCRDREDKKHYSLFVNVTFVFIHVTSIVKPVYIFMERSRVCKSLIEAKLCFHSFVHFGSVPIYRYVFSAFTTSSVLAKRKIIYLSVCLSVYLSIYLSLYL